MKNYISQAQELVKEAGYGGGNKVINEVQPYLDKLADLAREDGDEEAALEIESLSEALIVANLT